MEVPQKDFSRLVVAYEPVWAIGTGLNATPNEAEEMHKFIRDLIEKYANNNIVENIRIIYGGSVRVENVEELIFKVRYRWFLVWWSIFLDQIPFKNYRDI